MMTRDFVWVVELLNNKNQGFLISALVFVICVLKQEFYFKFFIKFSSDNSVVDSVWRFFRV